MSDAIEPEVLGKDDPRVQGLNNLEKELKRFNDGLPYDRDRVIARTQQAMKGLVLSQFEAGCGMILLYENEPDTYPAILAKYFPGVSESAAERWRKFARFMAAHPQFKAFIEDRGGYSIGLTLIESLGEASIQELEETGEFHGLTWDKISRMSVRQLQKALLKAKAAQEKAVKKATEQLSKENADLKEEVDTLKAQLNNQDVEAAQKLLSKAGSKITEAANLLRKIPREHLAADGLLRQSAYSVLAHAKGIAEDVEMEIAVLAGDPAEQVRSYMGKLQAQAKEDKAESAGN